MLKKFKVYLEYVTLINPKQECANQDYAMVKGILYDWKANIYLKTRKLV